MGFVKRYVKRDLILSKNSFEEVLGIFKADAVFLDMWSSNFVNHLSNKNEYQTNREKLIKEQELNSGVFNTGNLDSYYLSNILINLKINPHWIDIYLCLQYFKNVNVPSEISGKFELIKDFCIKLICSEFEKTKCQ